MIPPIDPTRAAALPPTAVSGASGTAPTTPASSPTPDAARGADFDDRLRASRDAAPIGPPAPATATELLTGPFRQLDALKADLQRVQGVDAKLGKLPLGSREWRELNSERMSKVLSLQMRMQDASFHAELAAKVVEHAAGGTKTILQTQA